MIKLGKKYRINKPKDTEEWPGWTPGMERYDGAVIPVYRVYDGIPPSPYVVYDDYMFNLNWITPVNEFKGN